MVGDGVQEPSPIEASAWDVVFEDRGGKPLDSFGFAAFVDEHGDDAAHIPVMFLHLDANDDGVVNRQEFQGMADVEYDDVV